MKTISLITLLLISIITNAQQTGRVDYPYLGLSFTIPPGWQGQETESGFLMGSHTEPGVILILPSDVNSLEILESNAHAGISDENGTHLQLSGNLDRTGSNGVGGTFEGMLEWQSAKAYIIGMINTFGDGVTIMVATSKEAYASIHSQLAKQIAASIQFSEPVIPPVAKQWGEALKGTRLKYMHSSYSNDGSYGDSGYTMGSSSSSEETIHLCAEGYFKYSSSNSMSFDTGGGFGSSSGNGKGAGEWKVVGNASGQAVLQLNFSNGEVYEYVITQDGEKTMLNGSRYFKTSSGEYAPDCY
ncbi:MAG: hypothetical protein KJP00_00690 [Bacteroidia bacterium]|nr:hypothetical protein [Bacteroidia bacterium]